MKKTLILLLAIILVYPTISHAYSDHDNGNAKNEEDISESIKKVINIKDEYNLEDYFTTEELNTVISTNPSVADINNNNLELYRVGKTDIVYEDETNYKVLHLIVTKDNLESNPKTTATSVFAIILGVVLILSLISLNRKTYE